ncbi:MAG: AMP-binding protein [Alphaproteobacteria bacterium]|nr:AMP-binding protein [Alphaproteobacteria bacterium]
MPDRLAKPRIEREDWADGSIVLHNRTPLPDPLPDILDRWNHGVENTPEAIFVSERHGDTVHAASYAEIDRLSDSCACRLREAGALAQDRVAVVAGANIAHAVVKLATLKANLIHVPLSPVLLDTTYGRDRLAGLLATAGPRLILSNTDASPQELPVTSGLWLNLKTVANTDASHHHFSPEPANPSDPAAIYFTSGSTGDPKGVSITREMIASNQSAYAAHWPFLSQKPPVLIDWLPWHHVFGGLDNFYKMIWNGGAYHIETPPHPEHMEAMAARIRDVRPTIHINVPYGIDLLLDHLDQNPETRAALFDRLDLIFFAGAGMGAETWKRLQESVAAGPHGSSTPPTVVSGYGATEAASTMCLGHQPANITSEIGLPLPGHSVRLAPVDGAYEVRFKGPNVAPGYVDADGLSPLKLDEAEFLCTGDLAQAHHAGEPERGLCFDGRIAEDFKLTTGTRVKVGALRHALLASCAPHLQDVAIAGAGRDRIAVILFPTQIAIDQFAHDELQEQLATALNEHNAAMPGSSTSVYRAVLADGPPDRSAGEITDKGHLAQSRCLKNRAALVEQLYASPVKPEIMYLSPTTNTD